MIHSHWIIVVIALVRCLSVESVASMSDPMIEQPFVDILISDYFKVEQNLWMLIERRADNVLLQVYKTHENFFNRTIFQTGSGILGANLVTDINALVDVGTSLNATAELGYNYLREQELDRKSITDYANYSLKILKDASELFDFTIKDEFWEKIVAHFKQCHTNGDTVQSSHQIVFDLYRDIQSGLLKSYITSQMSYMILAYYNTGESYSEQMQILRTTFHERFSRIREITKNVLKTASKAVWKCDVTINNIYSSYTEITNFLQGFVDNEANLNADASCTATCADYRETRHFQCQSGSLCDRGINDHDTAKCNGVMRHCEEIDNSELNICETGDTNRRYNFIKYSDGRTAGYSNAVCHGRAPAWTRWFVKCSNCICMCDDRNTKKSDRYFSLREVVSNIADNKIITGVMLTKQNGVIHLAVSERNLLPFGQAEISSPYSFYETWKGIPDFFSINDVDIRENIDYYTLTYENRSINLDQVVAPKGHLVTGVRFRVVNGHIALEIRATEFDFSSGKLKNLENSMWMSNPNCGQTEITVNNVASPIKSPELSILNETPNAFVKFGPTGYWSDVSQLTVPFFDTQRVEPYNPVALSGIGLYHKAAPGYGGFIGPKLLVYDFESYIVDD